MKLFWWQFPRGFEWRLLLLDAIRATPWWPCGGIVVGAPFLFWTTFQRMSSLGARGFFLGWLISNCRPSSSLSSSLWFHHVVWKRQCKHYTRKLVCLLPDATAPLLGSIAVAQSHISIQLSIMTTQQQNLEEHASPPKRHSACSNVTRLWTWLPGKREFHLVWKIFWLEGYSRAWRNINS